MRLRCILLFLLCGVPAALFASDDGKYSFEALARFGAFVPLGEMDERAKVSLPYFGAGVRIAPPKAWSRWLVLEIEAGFFAYRGRDATSTGLPSYRINYRRPYLYSEPVLAGVGGNFTVWKGLYLLPGFGAGMIFNQVLHGDSPGSYNHVACTAGLELGYRFSELVSAFIRTRGVFAFDRNRIFYHINPDAGISFHF